MIACDACDGSGVRGHQTGGHGYAVTDEEVECGDCSGTGEAPRVPSDDDLDDASRALARCNFPNRQDAQEMLVALLIAEVRAGASGNEAVKQIIAQVTK